jgi:hypothetical protein
MVPFKGNGAVVAVINLRLVPTSISDIYNMISYWYAVSQAYKSTLIP